MPATNTISIEKLVRLIGTPKCPTLIDVWPQPEFEADPLLIPSYLHRTFENLEVSSEIPGNQPAVVICREGGRHPALASSGETLVKNAPKHEELMQEMETGGDHEQNGEHK